MNGTVPTRIALALMLTAAIVPAGAHSAPPGLTFAVTPVATTAAANEHSPVIDARYVVYVRYSMFDSTPNSDVYVRDLKQGISWAITTDTSNQSNPDLSYDLVAYDDDRHGNREIYLYDINEDSEVRITTKSGDQIRPRISNRTIIWYDAATGSLWYRDLLQATNKEMPGTAPITTSDHWDIDGDTVVLTMGDALYTWPVGHDMGPKEVTSIGGLSFASLRTHAGQAAFTILSPDGFDVTKVSLADGTPAPVDVTMTRDSRNADLFGRNVVWQQDGAGNENIVFAYLGESGWDNVGVTNDDETDPSIFGRRVVFRRPGSLVGTDVYMGSATPEAARTQGADRYQTAIQTSKAYFDHAKIAVICTGKNFPDALAAAPLAKVLEAPLLLVPGTYVPSGLLDELTRLGVIHVFVIGGEDVVSASVETQLAAGRSSTRVAGDDRYETAQKIAYLHYDITTMSNGLPWYGYAFIARGDAFPDALAVAPVAASVNAPVLLTRPNSLPTYTADALRHIAVRHPVVIGGSDVVSTAVKNEIQAITVAEHSASPTERWEGPDRYATAVNIVARALAENWIDLDTLGIVTGTNFPDALGAGAALADYGSPLLLVRKTVIPEPVDTFVNAHAWDIGRIDVFGGTDVVNSDVQHSLRSRLK